MNDDDDDDIGLTIPIARALERLAAELREKQATLDAASAKATAPILGFGLTVTVSVKETT